MKNKSPKFFIDFDGTISTIDVVDLILERFAPHEWKNVEKEWVEGKIGSRECLSRQMALVQAGQEEVRALLAGVGVDPYFGEFLKTAQELSIPVTVVSDGFDFSIQEILKRSLEPDPLKNLPIFSNRLEWHGSKPKAIFNTEAPCEHGCANCKQRILARLTRPEDFVVFIGDGLSDRFAAKAANLTFAKGKLLQFCRDNRITHKAYSDFKEIRQWMESELLNTGRT